MCFGIFLYIYSIDAFCFSYFAWVFSSSSSSSSVIPTAAFARNIYVMSRIMHGFRGDCDSVCAIKCDKYYCFCFTVQMKKGEKKTDQAKNQRNESPMNVIFVRPSKNAKCKEGRLNATFFSSSFLSLSFIWLHVEHTIVISMYLKHKNQPTMQKKLIILLSLFFYS